MCQNNTKIISDQEVMLPVARKECTPVNTILKTIAGAVVLKLKNLPLSVNTCEDQSEPYNLYNLVLVLHGSQILTCKW